MILFWGELLADILTCILIIKKDILCIQGYSLLFRQDNGDGLIEY